MKNLLQRARKTIKIKNMLFLTIAGIINAFGITIFLNPVNLYASGISGTAMLAAQLTPESLSLSLFLIFFNLPLFLFGLKKQGKKFTFYAIYTVAVYSFVSWLITDVLPVDVSMASPLAGTDLLLCAVFGGVISGIGSGLAIKFGGAMDGIEVMAVIFAKKIGVSAASQAVGGGFESRILLQNIAVKRSKCVRFTAFLFVSISKNDVKFRVSRS